MNSKPMKYHVRWKHANGVGDENDYGGAQAFAEASQDFSDMKFHPAVIAAAFYRVENGKRILLDEYDIKTHPDQPKRGPKQKGKTND